MNMNEGNARKPLWWESFPRFWVDMELRGQFQFDELGWSVRESKIRTPMATVDVRGSGDTSEWILQTLIIRMMRAFSINGFSEIAASTKAVSEYNDEAHQYERHWRKLDTIVHVDKSTRIVELLQQKDDEEKALRTQTEIQALEWFEREVMTGVEKAKEGLTLVNTSAFQGFWASALCRVIHMKHLGGYPEWVKRMSETSPERCFLFDGTLTSIPQADKRALTNQEMIDEVLNSGRRGEPLGD